MRTGSANPQTIGARIITGRGFEDYLLKIGVVPLPPRTCVFDPGVAPAVLESHLQQSAHLMAALKVSMACWLIADRGATERKLSAARAVGVPTGAGGGPYEVAVAQGRLPEYLQLCAQVGFDRVECAAGFTDPAIQPADVVALAHSHGLRVDYELGKKHDGRFDERTISGLLEEGRRWLDAGASRLIVEARESASQVGLFSADGQLDARLAERLADAFGLELLVFEAPTKASQFALLGHFGPAVRLGNVPLDELLRVEIYRRGLHSDAFADPGLRPACTPTREQRP